MDNYDGLLIAGGTGIMEYRIDGSYTSQGTGTRLVSSTDIQAAAEKLNDLAIDALTKEKTVLAQCHGASLPVNWRIPGTSGPGAEALGFSLLKNNQATGYLEAQTPGNPSSVLCSKNSIKYSRIISKSATQHLFGINFNSSWR